MTGVWIAVLAIVVALAFGGYRRFTDGQAKPDRANRGQRLGAYRLGKSLGSAATLVQFSSAICAPCRTTHQLLAELTADDPAVIHIEIDAETRLDLVDELGITRTPTVLLLDGEGVVRHRIVGAARRTEVTEAIHQVAGRLAA